MHNDPKAFDKFMTSDLKDCVVVGLKPKIDIKKGTKMHI